MRPKKLFIILILCLVILPATPALAEEVTADDIAEQLMCSCSCELALSECDCSTQEETMALIEQKLAQGESQQEILAFFVTQYGEQILAPPTENRNSVLWISALTGILAVAAVTYLALKKRARGK